MSYVQGQFSAIACWDSLTSFLRGALPGANVEAISDKDFNDNGELILVAPAIRVMYVNTTRQAIENQRTAYESTHHFLVIAGDDDKRSSQDQARASLALAVQIEPVIAGTRLALSAKEITEPIALSATEPLPVKGLGVGYAVAIEVPGPSVFPGIYAYPSQEDDNNG